MSHITFLMARKYLIASKSNVFLKNPIFKKQKMQRNTQFKKVFLGTGHTEVRFMAK